MKKQTISAFTALAMAATLITGCGETTLPTPENDKTAVVDDASNDTDTLESNDDESTIDRLETTSMEESNVSENEISATENENQIDMIENEIDATENLIGMTEDEKKEFEKMKADPENTTCAYYHQDQMPKPTDYGVTVTSIADIPKLSRYKWDFEKHPIWFGYTDKGYMCVYDPTGMLFGRDKETTAIWNYIEKMGYDNCFQITYDEAVELFGKPDMSTMSTSDWGCSDYKDKLVNK